MWRGPLAYGHATAARMCRDMLSLRPPRFAEHNLIYLAARQPVQCRRPHRPHHAAMSQQRLVQRPRRAAGPARPRRHASGAGDHQRDLAPHLVRGRPRGELRQASPAHFLICLGQLTAHRRTALSAEGGRQGLPARRQPARRLERDQRARILRQRGQPGAAIGGPAGQKALEAEPLGRPRPATATAAVTADGPGSTVTGRPRATASVTNT